MADSGLYVVVLEVAEPRRRALARATLDVLGSRVANNTWELPTAPAGLRRAMAALSVDLREGDAVRVYPVCKRCREQAVLFGDVTLASLPDAWIF